MSSWKKYGGKNTFEGSSDIQVNSLVTNYFTILKGIVNDINIVGNIDVTNRLDVHGNVFFGNNLDISGNVVIKQDLDICGNVVVHKNIVVNENITVLEDLYFQDDTTNIFLHGDTSGIGVNKRSPEASLDIDGNKLSILNVQSSLIESHNILCRNVSGQGIILSVDASSAAVEYYFDTSININDLNAVPDAYIKYKNGGILQVDANACMQVISKLVITDNSSNIVNDAIVTIYNDLENEKYLYDIYDLSSVYTGTSITGIAVDNSGNSFIKLITKNSKIGGAIGGGAYPKDTSRSMLTLGTTDYLNNIYIPNQTIVSGTNNVMNKTTLCINKYMPNSDKYAVDINGAIHLENINITNIAKIPFEVRTMRFSRKNMNYGIIAGGICKPDPNYSQQAYVTKDGGNSWYSTNFITNNEDPTIYTMFTSSVYYNEYALLYGALCDGWLLDISNNRWYKKLIQASSSYGDENYNAIDMFITDFSGNNSNNTLTTKVFVVTSNSANTLFKLRYFNAAFGNNADNYVGSKYVLYKDNSNNITDNEGYYFRKNISGGSIDGARFPPGTNTENGGYIYIAGLNIQKYYYNDFSNIVDIPSCTHYPPASNYYNAISVFDMSNIVAVGNGIITYTKNGGIQWTDISVNTSSLDISGIILRSVNVYDELNAIAVGENGKMVYTIDGFYTWQNVPPQLLDLSSAGFQFIDASLNDVTILNKNSFIVANRIALNNSNSNSLGNANIMYNHIPALFNSENNNVIDVSGNMTISGNITIDKPIGNINSTGNTMYFMNNTKNIYIGTGIDSSNLTLGNNYGGKVFVNTNLDISENVVIHGNTGLTVTNGNIDISNGYLNAIGTNISELDVKVLTVNGGDAISRNRGGIDLSYAFYVGGYRPAVRIDGSMIVQSLYVDTSTVFFGSIISNSASNESLRVKGGSRFDSNINLSGGTMYINSDISASFFNETGALWLSDKSDALFQGKVLCTNQVILNGTTSGFPFKINNGIADLHFVKIREDLAVEGTITAQNHTTLNDGLSVTGKTFLRDIDISGNVDMSGDMVVSGNITANGIPVSSDYRIKRDIIPLFDTSFNVDNLNPVYYYNTMTNTDQIGFIAHELQEPYPFLVNGVKDGDKIQSVNYTGLIGVLVQEIKDLKNRVSELEKYVHPI